MNNSSTPNITTLITKSTATNCHAHFYIWYYLPMLILGIMITVINFFIFIFIKTSRTLKRNAGNFILMGLSLIDTFTGLHAILHSTPVFYFLNTNSCGGEIYKSYRNAEYLISKICMLGSIGHLLLLAGERMIRLFRPLRFKSIIVGKKVIPIVLLVWFISILLPIIELTYRFSKDFKLYQRIHVSVTIIGFWIFPLVLLCIQYIAMLILIYHFQRKRSRDMKSTLIKYKAFFIYLSMFLSFLTLSSPHFAIRIIIAFVRKIGRIPIKILGTIALLRYVPSLINPFIYAMLKDDFQKAFSRRFQRSFPPKSDVSEGGWTMLRLSTRKSFVQKQPTVIIESEQLKAVDRLELLPMTELPPPCLTQRNVDSCYIQL
ncbi:adenosine receptor A3-like [Clytia hemisphaerica]|uniref:adenosine receptor A3-like n=1 Tax=Clytia hemisphaerica TaxID=252671 RepID=UPI0034D6B1CC|eukprot:TCONS_00008801-protein